MTDFDDKTFYDSVRGELFDGSLSKRQVIGTDAILAAWRSGYPEDDHRWLAYALATAYHETGRAMYPVPEGGRGKGHPYGVAQADGQIAYGRGYVQLTWAANYQRADDELHLQGKLVANYELALDPDIAADILLRGMVEGWFTKFKLTDYLNAQLSDYLHARRIVNGMDRAEIIAGYAVKFATALVAAQRRAADTTASTNAPAPPTPAAAPVPQAPTAAQQAAAVQRANQPGNTAPSTFDPIGDIAKSISEATGLPNLIAPAPATPSSKPASESSVTTAFQGLTDMFTTASTAIGLIKTVMGGASLVAQYAPLVPTLIKDVEGDIVPAAEQLFTDCKELINDVETGKYGEAASVDAPKIFTDLQGLVDKSTLTFEKIAGAVNKSPTLPSVAGLQTAKAA